MVGWSRTNLSVGVAVGKEELQVVRLYAVPEGLSHGLCPRRQATTGARGERGGGYMSTRYISTHCGLQLRRRLAAVCTQ